MRAREQESKSKINCSNSGKCIFPSSCLAMATDVDEHGAADEDDDGNADEDEYGY